MHRTPCTFSKLFHLRKDQRIFLKSASWTISQSINLERRTASLGFLDWLPATYTGSLLTFFTPLCCPTRKYPPPLPCKVLITIQFIFSPSQYCSSCRCSKLLHLRTNVVCNWKSVDLPFLLVLPLHRLSAVLPYQLEDISFCHVQSLDTTLLFPWLHSGDQGTDSMD